MTSSKINRLLNSCIDFYNAHLFLIWFDRLLFYSIIVILFVVKEKWSPPTPESENPKIYKRVDRHYSDKPHHLERSIANDPRPNGHIKHRKKK